MTDNLLRYLEQTTIEEDHHSPEDHIFLQTFADNSDLLTPVDKFLESISDKSAETDWPQAEDFSL